MIVLSNTAAQTIEPGQTIIFNEVILHSGDGECWRKSTGSIKMRRNGIYEIHFAGNVAAAEPVQLAIQLSGVTLPETTMMASPGGVTAFTNVATATLVKNCCCDYDRISVTNTGTAAIDLAANPCLFVKRLS